MTLPAAERLTSDMDFHGPSLLVVGGTARFSTQRQVEGNAWRRIVEESPVQSIGHTFGRSRVSFFLRPGKSQSSTENTHRAVDGALQDYQEIFENWRSSSPHQANRATKADGASSRVQRRSNCVPKFTCSLSNSECNFSSDNRHAKSFACG